MEPVTLIVVAVLVSIGAGFGAGWGLKPDASVKALQAQTAAIEALQEGQTAILAEASKPIVLDAELKATLAEVPVQCRTDLGGDVSSVQCRGRPAFSSASPPRSDRSAVRSSSSWWTRSRSRARSQSRRRAHHVSQKERGGANNAGRGGSLSHLALASFRASSI